MYQKTMKCLLYHINERKHTKGKPNATAAQIRPMILNVQGNSKDTRQYMACGMGEYTASAGPCIDALAAANSILLSSSSPRVTPYCNDGAC